jgi:hypothetical protein
MSGSDAAQPGQIGISSLCRSDGATVLGKVGLVHVSTGQLERC